ncbi:hypothetical protein KOI35_33470 [Actinoplanes bogorensis]|uniref:Uncharacterized protein n=1 Tax=Paractinoplanes bogorensis TaxID=1610840 RepID=A0ABS5Z0D4_9ACTN|nr:hypothetical protein [Actinoplanes bogorensis]MBU2668434.1 hypothetical protein [Actinoplanes bogorensis]
MRIIAALLCVSLLTGCSAKTPDQAPATPGGATATAGGAAATAGGAAATPGGSTGTAGKTGPGSVGVVDCGDDIGGVAPDRTYGKSLDAVALPVIMLEPQDDGAGRLFAKTGLLVRAGTAVELTTTTPGVTIGWGSPGPEGTTIRVPACPSAHEWLAFAGGFHVTTPTCVPLTIRANGREARATVRVGAPC